MSKHKHPKGVAHAIAEHIRDGQTLKGALKCEGVDRDTHYEWLEKASRGEKKYQEYADIVRGAMREMKVGVTSALLTTALSGNVAAIKFYLETAYPDEYQKMPSVVVQQNNGPNIAELVETLRGRIEVGSITDELDKRLGRGKEIDAEYEDVQADED